MSGFIQYMRKGGEPGTLYPLRTKTTTIGGSVVSADVRLKLDHPHLEDIHCIITVSNDGVASLLNKSKLAPVLVNNVPVKGTRVLRHKDKFEIVGKLFQYVNKDQVEMDVENMERRIRNVKLTPSKSERRSAMPLLKTKSPPQRTPKNASKSPLIRTVSSKIPGRVVPLPRSLSLSSRYTPPAKGLSLRRSVSGPLTPKAKPKPLKTPQTDTKVAINKTIEAIKGLEVSTPQKLRNVNTSRGTTPEVSKVSVLGKTNAWDVVPASDSDTTVSLSSCILSPQVGGRTRRRSFRTPVISTPSAMDSIFEETDDVITEDDSVVGTPAKRLTRKSLRLDSPAIEKPESDPPEVPFRVSGRKPIRAAVKSPDSTTTDDFDMSANLNDSNKLLACSEIKKELLSPPSSTRKSIKLQKSDSSTSSERSSEILIGNDEKEPSLQYLVETQTTKSIVKRSLRSSMPECSSETVTTQTVKSKSFSSYRTDDNVNDSLDKYYDEVFNISSQEQNNTKRVSFALKNSILGESSDVSDEDLIDLNLSDVGSEEFDQTECSRRSSRISKALGDSKMNESQHYPSRNTSASKSSPNQSYSAQNPALSINWDQIENDCADRNSNSPVNKKVVQGGTPSSARKSRASKSPAKIDGKEIEMPLQKEEQRPSRSGTKRSSVVSRPNVKTPSLASIDSDSEYFQAVDKVALEKCQHSSRGARQNTKIGTPSSIRTSRQRSLYASSLSSEDSEQETLRSSRSSTKRISVVSSRRSAEIGTSVSIQNDNEDFNQIGTPSSIRASRPLSLYVSSLSSEDSEPEALRSSRSSTKRISVVSSRRSAEIGTSVSIQNDNEDFNQSVHNSSRRISQRSSAVSRASTSSKKNSFKQSVAGTPNVSKSFVAHSTSPNDILVVSLENENLDNSSIISDELNCETIQTLDNESVPKSLTATPNKLGIPELTVKCTSFSNAAIENNELAEESKRRSSKRTAGGLTKTKNTPKKSVSLHGLGSELSDDVFEETKRASRGNSSSSTPKSLTATPNKSGIPELVCSTVKRDPLGSASIENVFTPPDNPKPSPVLRKSVRKITVNSRLGGAESTPGLTSLIRRSSAAAEVVESSAPDNLTVETETPKSALKPRRSKSMYNPPTEQITPVTPIRTDEQGEFKTPMNTPGLFESLKKSVMRSRKRRRESSNSVLKSSKKIKLTEDDSLGANDDDIMEAGGSISSSSSVVNSKNIRNILAKKEHSPKNDLTDVRGVKRLMATPREIKPPANDLTNVAGVKKLFRTPRVAKSPKNDLTNIPNLRVLLSPKPQRSPANDLTKVPNLRRVMYPEVQNSPLNDLTRVPNLRRIMSPRNENSPKNDLTSPKGLKKLMATPKVQREPTNDLSDVEGVAEIFNVSGVDVLHQGSDTENCEDLFDKLAGRPHFRTYRPKSMTPNKNFDQKKTTDEVPETSPRVETWVKEQRAAFEEVKPRRGKAQKTVKAQEVPHNATEAMEVENSTDAIVEEVKPRRGRAQKNVKAREVPNNSTESMEVENSVEEVKPPRGRGKKIVKAREVPHNSTESAEIEKSAEIVEEVKPTRRKAQLNVQEEVPVEEPKPKRGRTKKATPVAEEETEEAKLPPGRSKRTAKNEETVEAKPARSRRAKATEPVEDRVEEPPKPKSRRARKVASDEMLNNPDVPVREEEEKPAARPRGKATTKKEVEEVKPRRGRAQKIVEAREVPTNSTESMEVENSADIVEEVKPTRRKAQLNVQEEVVPVEEPKPKRGRTKKATPVAEEEAEGAKPPPGRGKRTAKNEETVGAKPARGRRAQATEPVEDRVEEPPKPKSRRARKVASDEMLNNPDVPVREEEEKPAARPRGRTTTKKEDASLPAVELATKATKAKGGAPKQAEQLPVNVDSPRSLRARRGVTTRFDEYLTPEKAKRAPRHVTFKEPVDDVPLPAEGTRKSKRTKK